MCTVDQTEKLARVLRSAQGYITDGCVGLDPWQDYWLLLVTDPYLDSILFDVFSVKVYNIALCDVILSIFTPLISVTIQTQSARITVAQ